MTIPIVYAGIDLAKNVFALHDVSKGGRLALVRPSIRCDQLVEAVANLPPYTIGMEAWSGMHHWARPCVSFGRTIKPIAPKFAAPHWMGGTRGNNDAAYAEPGHRQS